MRNAHLNNSKDRNINIDDSRNNREKHSNENKIKNNIRNQSKNSPIANENQNDTNKNESNISSNKNGLNGIKYRQQDMEEGKNGNSISDKNKNINNKQSENDKKIRLEIKDKNKLETKYDNPDNKQVTNSQRKPTALYIILSIVLIPTVILSIICIGLAIWFYKFNCELEKSALQTLENNDQEAPEENQNKNTNNRIPEIDELNKKIISTGDPSRFE